MATKRKAAVVERTETCKNCNRVDFGTDTSCRRFPPSVLTDANGVITGSAWPIVPPDGWCAEFTPKHND